jgi:hypothetical protein
MWNRKKKDFSAKFKAFYPDKNMGFLKKTEKVAISLPKIKLTIGKFFDKGGVNFGRFYPTA